MLQKSQNEFIDSELAGVRTILDIDPAFRNVAHCKTIIKFLKNGKYLEKGRKITDDLTEFARQLFKEVYQENENIFKQGDIGDKYYIILKGKITVYQVDADNNEKELNVMGVKKSFGEIALLEDTPRTATVRAATKTELMVIQKDIYKKYCGKQRNLYIKKVRAFFEENTLMRSLSHSTKLFFAQRSFPKKWLANTLVVSQGKRAENLYFISKGGLKIVRRVKKRSLKNMELSREYKKEFNMLPEEIKLDLKTLYKGSQVGEYEFLHKCKMKNDIITVIPTLLISINRTNLNDVPREDEKLMENNTEAPQKSEEIMKIYLENCYWKRYKKTMVKNVLRKKRQKFNIKKKLPRVDFISTIDTKPFYQFLSTNGWYVFSGSGIDFPEAIKEAKSPFDKEEVVKKVGFGSSYVPKKINRFRKRKKRKLKLPALHY